jgi:hypothetical protein
VHDQAFVVRSDHRQETAHASLELLQIPKQLLVRRARVTFGEKLQRLTMLRKVQLGQCCVLESIPLHAPV